MTATNTITIVLGQSQGYGCAVTFDPSLDSFIVRSWDDEVSGNNWTCEFKSIVDLDNCLAANLWSPLSDHPDYRAALAAHDRKHRARMRACQRADDVFAYCMEDGTSTLTTRKQAEELGLEYPDRVIQTGTKEHMEVLLRERLLHRVYPDESGAGTMDVAILTTGQWCYRDELPEYPHIEVDHILRYGTEPWYQWRLGRFEREGN